MQEMWKDIEGYEGLYQVSNLGRVKSLERKVYNRINKEKILKMFDNGRGYLQVLLQKRRKIVKQFDMNGNFIKLWKSVNEASQVLNIARQNISACCLSKNYKSAGGYIWKYESEVC